MQKTALKMKQEGYSLESIERMTGLATEQIAEAVSNFLTSHPTTALKMKQKGASLEFIQEVTGLPTEQIAKL